MKIPVQIFIVAKPHPVAIFFAEDTLHDYGTKDRFKRVGKENRWEQLATIGKPCEQLGFDDGLIAEPYRIDGGRLVLSGHSLWRLMVANAWQRENAATNSDAVGKLFVGEDRERAQWWMGYVLSAILYPDRFPATDDQTRRILEGEAQLRRATWIEIKEAQLLPMADE
jgi:hypothetical protein